MKNFMSFKKFHVARGTYYIRFVKSVSSPYDFGRYVWQIWVFSMSRVDLLKCFLTDSLSGVYGFS